MSSEAPGVVLLLSARGAAAARRFVRDARGGVHEADRCAGHGRLRRLRRPRSRPRRWWPWTHGRDALRAPRDDPREQVLIEGLDNALVAWLGRGTCSGHALRRNAAAHVRVREVRQFILQVAPDLRAVHVESVEGISSGDLRLNACLNHLERDPERGVLSVCRKTRRCRGLVQGQGMRTGGIRDLCALSGRNGWTDRGQRSMPGGDEGATGGEEQHRQSEGDAERATAGHVSIMTIADRLPLSDVEHEDVLKF